MGYLVLAAGLVQAAFGVTLLVSWARHAHGQDVGLIVTHVVAMLGFFVPWTVFVVTSDVLWAWLGFGVLTVFIGFGDAAVVRLTRRMRGETNSGLRDYGHAIVAACSGRLGRRLQFHTYFSPVVFFGVLAVAIAATAVTT
jgi:hypothetical protein